MTEHNNRLLDIYTDYLLSSFAATTATGLARLLPELSHDAVTRFLSQQPLSERDLWKIVKPQVRAVESEDGVLIIDDTVQEKPYTDQSELITWHYDHSQGRTVKGINLLSALYLSREVSLPVAFELIQKTTVRTALAWVVYFTGHNWLSVHWKASVFGLPAKQESKDCSRQRPRTKTLTARRPCFLSGSGSVSSKI